MLDDEEVLVPHSLGQLNTRQQVVVGTSRFGVDDRWKRFEKTEVEVSHRHSLGVPPRDDVKWHWGGLRAEPRYLCSIETELVLIGELAKRSLTTRKAILTYEARGLIASSLRAANRYRYFDASLAKIVPVFANMLSIGLTLRDIREIFAPAAPIRACPPDADLRASMRRAEPIYRRHLESIDAEMTDLVGRRRAFEIRLERCRLEIEASGAVELPKPFTSRRQVLPGHVAYERTTM